MIRRLPILIVAVFLTWLWAVVPRAWFVFILVVLCVLFFGYSLIVAAAEADRLINDQLARDRRAQRKVLRFQDVERRRRG